MTRHGRLRLVDLAAHLDLAPSTVSRALAGSTAVAQSTRARVLAAAAELGYKVNPAASGLKRGRTMNIGLIAVMNHWYTGAVTSGADRVAAERGYDFVVMNSAGRADEDLLLERASRLGTRVDGALIVDVSPDGGLLDRLIDAVASPVVLLGCVADAVPSVLVDNQQIGARAAAHLRELGHRRAAVLALTPPTPSAINNARDRSAGFWATFEPGADAVTTFLPRDDQEARQQSILDATADVTSVFCASDALAIETLSLLRQAGRPVPEQISVVGVDDHPLSQPIGLTTIAQAPEEMGELATRSLLDTIGGEPGAATVIVPTELVQRQSTDRPPS